LALRLCLHESKPSRSSKAHTRELDIALLVGGEERLRADREADGFEPFAAEDEHGDADVGAGDGDFSCVDAIDGFGDGRARGVRRAPARGRRNANKSPYCYLK